MPEYTRTPTPKGFCYECDHENGEHKEEGCIHADENAQGELVDDCDCPTYVEDPYWSTVA